MYKYALFMLLVVIALSGSSTAQQTKCTNDPTPPGWVTIATNCSSGQRTIEQIVALPADASLAACAFPQEVPSGWVITSYTDTNNCTNGFQDPNTYTLRNLNGSTATNVTVCDTTSSNYPSPWVINDMTSNIFCDSRTNNAFALANLGGLPPGTSSNVCINSKNPIGWTTLSQFQTGSKCPGFGNSNNVKTIRNDNPPAPQPPDGIAAVLQWGAQDPAIGHVIGHADTGGTWTVPFPGSQNWMSYGPYTTIASPGDYVAAWELSNSNNTSGLAMGNIDVNDHTGGDTEIATRQPLLTEWNATNTFRTKMLPFSIDSSRAGHQFEFRIFWFDAATTTERVLGYVPMQWNAQDSNLGHVIGGIDDYTGFPGWSASVGAGQNWFQYGPYTPLNQAGTYIALWTLQIDNNTADNSMVVTIDVNDATSQQRITSLDVRRMDFKTALKDQVFPLQFSIDSSRAGHQFEFRVWYWNQAYIREQAVGVVKLP